MWFIDTEKWRVIHDQSPRCADMLRREKHLYQFMLVWNCRHLFAQKLLFSVSLLLGYWFHMIDVSQSATILVSIFCKSTILKVYLLLAILPLKYLPLLQRIILTSMLYQLRWRNTFMELVWQPCSFHRWNIRVWNTM